MDKTHWCDDCNVYHPTSCSKGLMGSVTKDRGFTKLEVRFNSLLKRVTELESQNAALKEQAVKDNQAFDNLEKSYFAVRDKLHRAMKALKDFGEHYPECVCFGDKARHAADCRNCDCGLLEEIEACE